MSLPLRIDRIGTLGVQLRPSGSSPVFAAQNRSYRLVGHALLVPQTAVARTPSGDATVTLVKGDNAVEVRPVTLGVAQGRDWVVASGLAAGERVIVEGLAKLRPGIPVKPVPAGSPAPAQH